MMKKNRFGMKRYVSVSEIKNVIALFVYFNIMWILFGWTRDTPDYNNYYIRFLYGTTEFGEQGFNQLISFIKNLGISEFQDFIKIISFIFLFFLFGVIRKYSLKSNYVLFLFFLYPFFSFCSGLRFTLSVLFIVIAIFIYMSEIKHNTIYYLILILVASSFHYLALFFLVLLLGKIPIKQQQHIIAICVMSIILAALTYTPFYSIILHVISDGSEKISANIAAHSRLGFILPIGFQIISFLIFKYAYDNTREKSSTLFINSEMLFKLNICELYVIPFYFINMLFMRLYMPFMLINTIFYSEVIFSSNFDKAFRMKLRLFNFGQYFYLFITQVAVKESVWRPFLENNEILTPIMNFFHIL